MTSYAGGINSTTYVYRADGMRVAKYFGLSGVTNTTTTYAYDGQMGFEDVDSSTAGTTVTDYGLGARGIDYISSTTSTGNTVGFPVYDAHGNTMACLFRSGASYTLGNQRTFDAWGVIRQGASTGDPKGRYCAALGHKQDDESGLVYMRARYYEPPSGRFLSEDDQLSGRNWFTYCSNNPINAGDPTGRFSILSLLNNPTFLATLEGAGFMIGGAFAGFSFFLAVTSKADPSRLAASIGNAEAAVAIFAIAFSGNSFSRGAGVLDAMVASGVEQLLILSNKALSSSASGANGLAAIALAGSYAYSLELMGCLVSNFAQDVANT
jgi:RHS repeat-associated protein